MQWRHDQDVSLRYHKSQFTYLSLIIYYNSAIYMWTWSIGMWKFKAYKYCFNFIRWHDVTSWRHDAKLWTCWRQLAKIVSMICLIPTTQIRICIGISVWLNYKISKCCRVMLSIDVTSWRDIMTWYHPIYTWTLIFSK